MKITNQQTMQQSVSMSDGSSVTLMPFNTSDAEGKRLDQAEVPDKEAKEGQLSDLLAAKLVTGEPSGTPAASRVPSTKAPSV